MSSELFKNRRHELLASLPDDAVLLLPAASERLRNRDSEYPFRQHSDFWYLTGFAEPDALLVLVPGRSEGAELLFCRPRDPAQEVWTGYRVGPAGAVADYGFDQAFALEELETRLPDLLAERRQLIYPVGADQAFDARVLGWLNRARAKARQGISAPSELVDLAPLVHERRLFKDEAEIALLAQAAEISAAGHRRAMRACRPGLYEYQLEAELLHEFMRRGARFPAYNSIVASGANACVLHYVENQRQLQPGELVLIDAGAELAGYAGDITRTFPVDGRFQGPARDLYEIVLEANRQAILAVAPGVSFDAPHQAALQVLTQGLKDLGILAGEVDGLIEAEAYRPYYMHRTGHWLGLDVHDVGGYRTGGHWRDLQPGMVLTIEPGLYIAPDAECDARFRGIGIRIEDDLLVTRQGARVLTAMVPKAIDQIESLMAADEDLWAASELEVSDD